MSDAISQGYSGDSMCAKEFRLRYSYRDHTLYTNTDGISPALGRCVDMDAMADRVRCYVHLRRMCDDFRIRIREAYGESVSSGADDMLAAPQSSSECQAAFDRVCASLRYISDAEASKCKNAAIADIDELEKYMNRG